MSQSFDPYLRWLGIRDPQRPPNHYRLLGIDLFESDVDVIASAADRQMAHVRSFQAGQHAELSQKILNELAAARVCLLKPDRKAAYDAELRKSAAAKAPAPKPVAVAAATPVVRPATAQPVPAKVANQTVTAASAVAEFPSFADVGPSTATRHRSRIAKKKASSPAIPILVGLAATILVAGFVVWNAKSKTPETARVEKPKAIDSAKPTTDNPTPEKPVSSENSNVDPPQPKSEPVKPVVIEPVIKPPAENPGSSPETADPTNGEDPSTTETPTSTDESDDAAEESSTDGEPAPEPEPKLPEPPAEPKDDRLPVPEKEAQAAALEIIKDLFKTEFAARKPEDRAAFAKKLLEQAGESANDATAAYVLYDQAVTMAAAVGDAEAALQAAEALGKRYQVDSLETQVTALTTLSRTVKTAQALKAVGERAASLTDEAITTDRYDVAKRFNSLTLSAARKSKDLSLVNRAQNRYRDIKYLEVEFAKIESSVLRLGSSPNDPEANLAVGRFFCFGKGDFVKGLVYLSRGSKLELRDLAIRELSHPSDRATQVELADGWWGIAEEERAVAEQNLKNHAAEWYRKALPSLEGLSKTAVEAKLLGLGERAGISIGKGLRAAILGSWKAEWIRAGGASRFVYNELVFRPDGTCSYDYVKDGTWSIDGEWVIARYRIPDRPQYFQRYRLDGDRLVCESFQSPGVAYATGTGVRVSR